MVYKIFIIYLAGLTGIFKAIPVGMVLQASPVWIALMTALGGLTAAVILYLFGEWVRNILEKRMSEKRLEKKKERTRRYLSKYGIMGLGVFGTLLLGFHITIILGLLVVKTQKMLLLWTIVGIMLWSSLGTIAVASGIDLFMWLVIVKP
jgi:membrane protein YqaA with SNARE-associated domain